MACIGLIGCGAIARQHVGCLRSIPGASLVAVYDTRPEAAEKMREFAGGEPAVCGTIEDLLRHRRLDALMVCTPTAHHVTPVVAGLEAGLHVFCEKPLARTPAEAEQIAQAVGRSSGMLTVGFVRRFDNEWNTMARLVRENALGRPVIWRSINALGVPAGWHFDDAMGGGPFLDGMIHNIDFALYLFGPARCVWATGQSWRQGATAFDTGTAVVEFDSGDQLVCSWSWGLLEGAKGTSYQDVIGPLGPLGWSNKPESPPEGYDPQRQGYFVVPAGSERSPVVFDRADMFAEQMKHFVRTIDAGTPPRAGLREGVISLRVATAVLEAMRTRETVRLDD